MNIAGLGKVAGAFVILWGGAIAPVSAQMDSISVARMNGALAEQATYTQAAALAWRQFDRLWQNSTGLASATPDYHKLTSWDIGSVLAALYSGRQLELIDQREYDRRLKRTLQTLRTMPLFEGGVFHKIYFASTAKMAGRSGAVSSKGYGWSATDLGRLLTWLRIIADQEPAHRAEVERIVERMNFRKVVSGGYLRGQHTGSRGQPWQFQEGRIGYEQYAARGFALWGQPVDSALDLARHARPIVVLGQPLLADARGLDRITSEPFILAGLETGWTPAMRELAINVLGAQEARYRETNLITIVSEDAVGVPPHYFYYYCVYCNGKPFMIDVTDPGKFLDKPRWVSTKAAFAWHVLLPGDYTRLALDYAVKARTPNGWASGVFEGTGKPTNTHDINTAAIILEAAAFRKLGRPFLAPRPAQRPL
ncbi:MAG: DUF3131 domain-containing protein [Gemmatimonadota bacterium]